MNKRNWKREKYLCALFSFFLKAKKKITCYHTTRNIQREKEPPGPSLLFSPFPFSLCLIAQRRRRTGYILLPQEDGRRTTVSRLFFSKFPLPIHKEMTNHHFCLPSLHSCVVIKGRQVPAGTTTSCCTFRLPLKVSVGGCL